MSTYRDDALLMDAYCRIGLLKVAEEIQSLRADPHLLLGVTKETVLSFVQNTLNFPGSYDRERAFGAKDDWITKAFGHKLTGYDLATSIKQWLGDAGNRHLSVSECLLKQDMASVGPAEIFLSHVQQESYEKTLLLGDCRERYLPSDKPIWLDYVVLRQCMKDFDPQQIRDVVQHIKHTFVVEDADFKYFTRSFCLFEVASTPLGLLQFPLSGERQSLMEEQFEKKSKANRRARTICRGLRIVCCPILLVVEVVGLLCCLLYCVLVCGCRIVGVRMPSCFGVLRKLAGLEPFDIDQQINDFSKSILDGMDINISKAEATDPEDQKRVNKFIIEQDGGFLTVGQNIMLGLQHAQRGDLIQQETVGEKLQQLNQIDDELKRAEKLLEMLQA